MKVNNKVVCGAPFVGANFSPRGFQVCCQHDREHYSYPTLEAWLASKELNEFKERMLAGEIDEICRRCSAGGHNAGFGMYEPIVELKERELYMVNFFISDECNLGCKTCSPHFSDTQNRFRRKVGLPHIGKQERPYDVTQSVLEVNRRGAKQVIFAGGDPVYSKVYKKAMLLLRKDLTANIVTNGMVWDKEFFDLVVQFQNYRVGFSIDGPKATNEFMRTFVSSERLYENLGKWIEEYDPKGEHVVIGVTLSNVSIWTIDELAKELFERFPEQAENFEYSFTQVGYPSFFAPHNLPEHLRVKVLEKLTEDEKKLCGYGSEGSMFQNSYRVLHETAKRLVSHRPFEPKDWLEFQKVNSLYASGLPESPLPLEWLCELQLLTTSSVSS